MKIKPIHTNVVVKPITKDEVTKSGIVLPDTVDKEKPEKGEVIAVGEGKILDDGKRAPMSVKAGDTVMFKKYSPDEIKVDGEEYLVISEGDILAIINQRLESWNLEDRILMIYLLIFIFSYINFIKNLKINYRNQIISSECSGLKSKF